MNEPRGPLPASVYRRRRVVAMAGSAVGAVLFVWAIAALLGGNNTPAVEGTANIRTGGVPPAAEPPSSNPPSSNPPSSGTLAPSSASGSPSPTPAALPASAATTTTPTTTTTTTPPGPPQDCPDSVVRVTATSGHPSYAVGAQPTLTLHITNVGPLTCIRDTSRQLRSIEVLSADGKTRLWSSSDCYTVHTDEKRTLAPKQSVAYSVSWAGRTSAPGCPAARAVVPAGSYRLVGTLGTITGPPTPLTLE